jgi:pantoate--beta-alanine ligase
MGIVHTIQEMREMRQKLAGSVGFVPTMGYFHEGHLTLVRKAKEENRKVVISIFVNPTQFGAGEDLNSYPRDVKRDLSLLNKEGVDVVFVPEVEEIYPKGFDAWVEVGEISKRLEGASRPGHFRGVTTVVAKLFNIVQPHRAYFGQKDAQQAIVVKKMVSDLNMNLEIVTVPTVRELDGLAMSSRNIYLDQEERKSALVLLKSLCLAKELWSRGERDAERIKEEMRTLIQSEPRAKIDYVSIADIETLKELEEINCPALVSLAVRIGKVRLIDNIIID